MRGQLKYGVLISNISHLIFLAQQHLTKTIEVTRVNLFNIITQYKAIFPDEDNMEMTQNDKPLQGVSCDGERLFQSWLHEKVSQQQI